MKNTKFIRAKVSKTADHFEQRLLEFEATKNTKYVRTCLHVANGLFTGYELKEVPDYEEEMREMLEELTTHHFNFIGCDEINELKSRVEALLTKIKQQS